jgi:hypothetical protein
MLQALKRIGGLGMNVEEFGLTQELKSLGLLKFEMLASGLRVSDAAWQQIARSKSPVRTRSGASGGLDVILPNDIHVNAPVTEPFALESPLLLDVQDGALAVKRGEAVEATVTLQSRPAYYGQHTSDGVLMGKVGQMCSSDRFCFGMTGPYCWFWKRDRRCQYCSIGLNKPDDASRKTIDQLLETLAMATEDADLPAKHMLIGGGTTDGEDMGAILASEICLAVKQRFNLSCYVMISAPLKNEYIDRLRDAGADELGMNIEFWSDAAWAEFIPGKNRHIGKSRYLEALEYAVSLFGPINTRSLIIAGLEDPEHTIEGAERLASMGVMPIISPFRPLAKTDLESRRGFDALTYWSMYTEIHGQAEKYGIPTGPTCIPCQNNILALPLANGQYRFY